VKAEDGRSSGTSLDSNDENSNSKKECFKPDMYNKKVHIIDYWHSDTKLRTNTYKLNNIQKLEYI